MTAERSGRGRERRTRDELVAEARALRALGLNNREIALRMGKSYSAVREWFYDPDGSKQAARRITYQGVCVDCGGVTKSDGTTQPSERCAECYRRKQREDARWTRAAVIDAIRRWARERGRRPLAAEWLRSDRGPDYPASRTVQRVFGSWANGIEAAGFERPRVGHKVNPHGQGRNQMPRRYIVLSRNGDGHWKKEERVEAFSPENAIETAAEEAGEYVAVLERYWIERTVATVARLAVVREGPPAAA